MVQPIGSSRGNAASSSSGTRLLIQMGVAIYAVAAALILVRCLYLSIGVNDGLWVGNAVYQFTDPLVSVLGVLPGADVELIGLLTVADVSLLALVVLVPVLVLARPSRR